MFDFLFQKHDYTVWLHYVFCNTNTIHVWFTISEAWLYRVITYIHIWKAWFCSINTLLVWFTISEAWFHSLRAKWVWEAVQAKCDTTFTSLVSERSKCKKCKLKGNYNKSCAKRTSLKLAPYSSNTLYHLMWHCNVFLNRSQVDKCLFHCCNSFCTMVTMYSFTMYMNTVLLICIQVAILFVGDGKFCK